MLMHSGRYAPIFPTSNAPFRRARFRSAGVFYTASPEAVLDWDAFGNNVEPGEEDECAADWADHMNPVLAALRRELRRYTYKPRFTMSITPLNDGLAGDPFAMYMLRIQVMVPDSRGSGRDIQIGGRYAVPYDISDFRTGDGPEAAKRREGHFQHFVSSTLMNFEEHEMREWFRRDGDLVDDPHARPGVQR